jgi:hypothetical protein
VRFPRQPGAQLNYKLTITKGGSFYRPRYSRDPLKLAAEAIQEMNDPKRQHSGCSPLQATVSVHTARLSGRASEWRTIFVALPHHKTTDHYSI